MLELAAMRAAMLLITSAAAMSARLERNMRRTAAGRGPAAQDRSGPVNPVKAITVPSFG
jgi:hypothetical protein